MTAAALAEYIADRFPKEHFPNGVPSVGEVLPVWSAGQAGQVRAILEGLKSLGLERLTDAESLEVSEIRGSLEHSVERWANEGRKPVGHHELRVTPVVRLYHLLRAEVARASASQASRSAAAESGRGASVRRDYALVPFDMGRIAEAFREALRSLTAPAKLSLRIAWTDRDGFREHQDVDLDSLSSVRLPEGASNPAFSAIFRDGDAGNDLFIALLLDEEHGATTLRAEALDTVGLKAIVEPFVRRLALTPWARAGRAAVPVLTDPPFLVAMDTLAPGAAAAYRQAVIDLKADRLSYQGPANELRQALWGVLQELAPDKEVMAEKGYEPEARKQSEAPAKPTHHQRAAFIMRKRRGQGQAIPDAMLTQIEAIAALARSAYQRSNASTHTARDREEAEQVHRLVELVLRDLLKGR